MSYRGNKIFMFLSPEEYKIGLESVIEATSILSDLACIVLSYYLCKENIYNTASTKLAIKYTGQVFVYENKYCRGATMVKSLLEQGIEEFYTTNKAFLVKLSNDRYITWGDANIDLVQGQLNKGVRKIITTRLSFYAHLDDQSVISLGGDSKITTDDLMDDIICNDFAVCALKKGNVITWGDDSMGGNSSEVQQELKDIIHISNTRKAFCALRKDGKIITWGYSLWGGDSSMIVFLDGEKVEQVISCDNSFCLKTNYNRLIIFGKLSKNINPFSAPICLNFTDIKMIYSNNVGFCAETNIGMVTWINGITSEFKMNQEIKDVRSSYCAFSALMKNGSVITWGGLTGGDSSTVSHYLQSGVKKITQFTWGFLAELQSGGSVAWGDFPWIPIN